MGIQVIVGIAFVLLATPFLVGLVTGTFRTISAAADATARQQTPREVYLLGGRLALLPAVVLFALLTASSLSLLMILGFSGDPRPESVLFLQRAGIVLVLAISVGGMTTAGSILGVYLRQYR